MQGFHARDGLTFERTDNGVLVRLYSGKGEEEQIYTDFFLDSYTWASVMASCTPEGDNGHNFRAAHRYWKGD